MIDPKTLLASLKTITDTAVRHEKTLRMLFEKHHDMDKRIKAMEARLLHLEVRILPDE